MPFQGGFAVVAIAGLGLVTPGAQVIGCQADHGLDLGCQVGGGGGQIFACLPRLFRRLGALAAGILGDGFGRPAGLGAGVAFRGQLIDQLL